MELRIFSNSCCTANLDKDLREKMEAKVLAEFPNYTTKASAIEYLLKQAVDTQSSGEGNVAEVTELNAKIEAYQVQEEYLKAEIEKLKNAPAKVVEKTVNVEVPQKAFLAVLKLD